MGLESNAIYGNDDGIRTFGATMLNPYAASDDFDIGSVLAAGIRGAAQGAMQAKVYDAYASGQLRLPSSYQQPVYQSGMGGLMPLLIIGAVLYAVAGD